MLDTAGFYKRVCEAMGTDSPVEIARKLGMTKHAAYAWSKGGMPGKSRLGMVARLSMRTGTSIHYLLTGEGSLLGALVPGLSPELAREITLRAGKSGQEVTSVIEELIMTGMAAEKLIFGETTTGPQSDIEKATNLSRQMVTQYGMSEKLGPRTFGRKEELVFLGREISEQRNYSEKIAEEIDEEVRSIIEEAYTVATAVLTANRGKLDQLAAYLVQNETIEGEELEKLLTSPLPESAYAALPSAG